VAGPDSLGPQLRPVWRVDVVPVPDGPGPWRLRLRFASDLAWRGRGWQIARLDPLPDGAPAMPFPVEVDVTAGRLRWSWPWEDATAFTVQARTGRAGAWQTVWQGPPPPADGEQEHGLALDPLLMAAGGARWELRVIASVPLGDVASRPAICYPEGGPGAPPRLGRPYPNPGRVEIRVPLYAPDGARVELTLHDVRGRRVRRWLLAGGDVVVAWDGCDDAGRRVASGNYVFRLDGAGGTATRKVVWLR
jgi:hypothetical protein